MLDVDFIAKKLQNMSNVTNFHRDLLNEISEILPFNEEVVDIIDVSGHSENQFMIVINDGNKDNKKYVVTIKRWYGDD